MGLVRNIFSSIRLIISTALKNHLPPIVILTAGLAILGCDSGSDCATGEERASYSGLSETRGVGNCRDKIEVNYGSCGWETIQEEVLPASEITGMRLFDGKDNDCDGHTDEIDINGTSQLVEYCLSSTASINHSDFIHINNGGTLRFRCSRVVLGTDSFELDETSKISVEAVTYDDFNPGIGSYGGGTYDGGGGGGASHLGFGGQGGNGSWMGIGGLRTDSVYGSVEDFIVERGSHGGPGGGPFGGL
ncbi:MAG: hypothetical protein WC645_08010, partial [Candidatus Margulisiibacteriota bacterium]